VSRPREKLADFVLGTLPPDEAEEVAAHLEGCAACREEVGRLRGAFYALPEALTPVPPPASAWAGLRARLGLRRRGWLPVRGQLALGVSAALLSACLLWGLDVRRDLARVEAEQRVLTAWMTHPELSLHPLEGPAGAPRGVLCTYPDGRALLVQREPPPPGRVYRVWGVKDGARVSLGVTTTRVLRLRYEGFEVIEVGLEPLGGRSHPSELVGRVRLL